MTWNFNGDIDHGANVNHVDDGDSHVTGKVDGGSYVILVSNHGSVTIDGKVDGGSSVSLTAAGDIRIGVVGGDGDKKIDGGSHVDATAGGSVSLGNKIDGQHSSVDFKACRGITIGNKIDGGAAVRLLTATGSISVGDKIDNSATHVTFTAQDVLSSVVVSMGTMGVIYSIVLEVVPQFGLQQIVTPTSWSAVLRAARTSEGQLRTGNAQANFAMLNVILDGAVNGTGIAESENVYADLANNPFNQDCWITNRRVTPELPVDSNSPAT